MEELINQVAKKTGLPAEQARSAVTAGPGVIPGKLPARAGRPFPVPESPTMRPLRRASLLLALTGLLIGASLGDAPAQTKTKTKTETKTETKSVTSTGLTFELYKDTAGKFRWRLKDG